MRSAVQSRSNLVAEAHAQLDADLRRFLKGRAPEGDVDDLLQEIYVKLADVGSEVEHLSGFVYRVARNVVADRYRKRDVKPPEPLEDDSEPSASTEVASWLRPMIAGLPAPLDEALRLADLEGLSHAEAASRLGIPRSTFSSRVQKGRVELRKALTRCCHIELDARGGVMGWESRVSCCVD